MLDVYHIGRRIQSAWGLIINSRVLTVIFASLNLPAVAGDLKIGKSRLRCRHSA